MSILSSLLGLDASHNAGVAQNQANQQTQQANAYGQQAAGVYSGLNTQGGQQAKVYQDNYLGLLNRQGALGGVGPYAATGGPQGAQSGPGSATSTGGRQPFAAADPAQSDANNPYSLDPNQQQQLNQTHAHLAQTAQQAVASFTQQLAQRGITDPRAVQVGIEQIQEHYASLAAEQETAFYDTVKKEKEAALQSVIAGLEGYGKTGVAQEEAAGSGFLGLQGGAQNQAATQQNLSAQQQQLSAAQFGNVLNIGAYAAGGGFAAPKALPSVSPEATPINTPVNASPYGI